METRFGHNYRRGNRVVETAGALAAAVLLISVLPFAFAAGAETTPASNEHGDVGIGTAECDSVSSLIIMGGRPSHGDPTDLESGLGGEVADSSLGNDKPERSGIKGSGDEGPGVRTEGDPTDLEGFEAYAPRLWNEPNPFSGTTTVCFDLLEPASATLDIYDAAGRQVAHLSAGQSSTGVQRLAWSGDDDHGQPVAPGMYFCRLAAGDRVAIHKLLLVR